MGEVLLVQVIESRRRRVLGLEYPEILKAMDHLALTECLGWSIDRVLRLEHPEILKAMDQTSLCVLGLKLTLILILPGSR